MPGWGLSLVIAGPRCMGDLFCPTWPNSLTYRRVSDRAPFALWEKKPSTCPHATKLRSPLRGGTQQYFDSEVIAIKLKCIGQTFWPSQVKQILPAAGTSNGFHARRLTTSSGMQEITWTALLMSYNRCNQKRPALEHMSTPAHKCHRESNTYFSTHIQDIL